MNFHHHAAFDPFISSLFGCRDGVSTLSSSIENHHHHGVLSGQIFSHKTSNPSITQGINRCASLGFFASTTIEVPHPVWSYASTKHRKTNTNQASPSSKQNSLARSRPWLTKHSSFLTTWYALDYVRQALVNHEVVRLAQFELHID